MATLHAGGVHASHSTASSALIKEVENRERKCQSVAVLGCSLANFSSLHKRALPQQQASTIRLPGIEEIQQSPSWETGTLQPSSLLHHAVSHGRFSLRNVLSTPGPSTQVSSGEPSSTSAGDPITMGLVTIEMASSLFDDFMTYLNPYISQLDAQLHTFDYVRRKSAFLLSAVLAVSAKSSHPLIYERLLSHAEGLLSDCFMRGLKSTEIAQAVMLLTYWKKPEDSRAWVFLGYTVRMGMELGWHRLSRLSSADAASMSREQQLEHRNIERTWYVLFVYDRSMSLQTAKPWMIERSDFTESIEAWCREPLAVPTDILLGAFVTLRLLTSEVFKLLGGDNLARNGAGGGSSQFYPLCSFFAIIKGRIAEWESKWTQRAEQDCHQFLIRFYARSAWRPQQGQSRTATARCILQPRGLVDELLKRHCHAAPAVPVLISDPPRARFRARHDGVQCVVPAQADARHPRARHTRGDQARGRGCYATSRTLFPPGRRAATQFISDHHHDHHKLCARGQLLGQNSGQVGRRARECDGIARR
jgi:hypothetical protein